MKLSLLLFLYSKIKVLNNKGQFCSIFIFDKLQHLHIHPLPVSIYNTLILSIIMYQILTNNIKLFVFSYYVTHVYKLMYDIIML